MEAANVRIDTHGGYGFLDEYDVERKFGETRLYTVAPISNNLPRGEKRLWARLVGLHLTGTKRAQGA